MVPKTPTIKPNAPTQTQRNYVKATNRTRGVGISSTSGKTPSSGKPTTNVPPKSTPTPPQPTPQLPVKSNDEWLQDFQSKLDLVKPQTEKIVHVEGLDKTKLTPIRTLLGEALKLKTEKKYQEGCEKLEELDRELRLVAASTPAVKQMLRATNADRATFEKQMMLDTILAELPKEVDMTEVQRIITAHRSAVPEEIKVFKDFGDFQDVLQIKDEAKKKKALLEIGSAITAAKTREKQLAAALKVAIKDGANDPNATEEQKKPFRDAFALVVDMCSHIPEEFLSVWTPNFSARIDTLVKSPEEKAKELELAKKQMWSDTDKTRHRDVFKAGLEDHTTKEWERHDFFFDQLISPPDPAKLKEMYIVQDELIRKARNIRDLGGSIKDCEKVLDHIPKTWWPPEFVQELQAWRKTERLLARERVAATMKKESKKLETSKGCCEFVLSSMSSLENLTDIQKITEATGAKDWLGDAEIIEALAGFADNVKDGWKLGADWVEALRSGDFSKVKNYTPEKCVELSSKILDTMNATAKTVQNICTTKDFPIPSDSLMATKILPGIAIATCAVDLALALKNLAIHSRRAIQTRQMINKAEFELGTGEAEDGGAFVNALKNELGGRHVQISKDTVDVTVAGIQLTGAIVEATGAHGAPAGTIIKIVGSAIHYGSVIVFTNIEWGQANGAKKLLREAQAGNPIARMQIFEDSNRYAKMYIAICVQEKKPLATKFIEQRGIEEGDLDDSLSLQVLRELMLKDADQRDETDVADSLLEANIEGVVGKGVVRLGKGIANKIASIKEIGKDRKVPYDDTWTFKGAVLLTKVQWDTVKKEALGKGLFEESTGVGAALEKIAKAEEAVTKAKPTEMQAKRIALLDAVNEASSTIGPYSPMTNPHGEEKKVCEHKGMVIYCLAVVKALRAKADDVDLGPLDTNTGKRDEAKGAGVSKASQDWKPVKAASLVAADWEANFKDAVAKCNMENADNGVGDALKAAAKAAAAGDMQSTDPQKQRKARLATKEAHDVLVKALNGMWTGCGPIPEMRSLLTGMLNATAAVLKNLDAELYGSKVVWATNPLPATLDEAQFSATVWVDAITKADTAGVSIKGKGDAAGVGKALMTFGTKDKAETNMGTTQNPARVKLRLDCKIALSKVANSATKYGAAQKEMIEPLAKYVSFLVNHSRKKLGNYEEAQNKVEVNPKPTATDLVAADIRKVYNDAVKSGAIEPDEEVIKKFEAAVKEYKEGQVKFTSERDLEKKRKLATGLLAKLGTMRQFAAEYAGAYGSHESMGDYVKSLKIMAEAQGKSDEINEVLNGVSAPQKISFPATAFVWTDGDWQKAKKMAISKGLVSDTKTNFGSSLTKAKKAFDEAKKEGDKAKSDKYLKLKEEAMTAITTARTLADAMKNGTLNTELQKYFKGCLDQADVMIKALT